MAEQVDKRHEIAALWDCDVIGDVMQATRESVHLTLPQFCDLFDPPLDYRTAWILEQNLDTTILDEFDAALEADPTMQRTADGKWESVKGGPE